MTPSKLSSLSPTNSPFPSSSTPAMHMKRASASFPLGPPSRRGVSRSASFTASQAMSTSRIATTTSASSSRSRAPSPIPRTTTSERPPPPCRQKQSSSKPIAPTSALKSAEAIATNQPTSVTRLSRSPSRAINQSSPSPSRPLSTRIASSACSSSAIVRSRGSNSATNLGSCSDIQSRMFVSSLVDEFVMCPGRIILTAHQLFRDSQLQVPSKAISIWSRSVSRDS